MRLTGLFGLASSSLGSTAVAAPFSANACPPQLLRCDSGRRHQYPQLVGLEPVAAGAVHRRSPLEVLQAILCIPSRESNLLARDDRFLAHRFDPFQGFAWRDQNRVVHPPG